HEGITASVAQQLASNAYLGLRGNLSGTAIRDTVGLSHFREMGKQAASKTFSAHRPHHSRRGGRRAGSSHGSALARRGRAAGKRWVSRGVVHARFQGNRA